MRATFLGTVYCMNTLGLNGGSTVNVFLCVCWQRSTQHSSEKISGFPVKQESTEALTRSATGI